VADESAGRQLPFAFLNRVKDDFKHHVVTLGAGTAISHSLSKQFGPKLKEHMEYCMAHPDAVSSVASVQKQVDEVKNIMMDNIEKVLDRGEKIELLVDKTDQLRFQADNFHRTGRNLRRKMWMQNLKMKLALVFVVLAVIGVLVAIICGSGGCKS